MTNGEGVIVVGGGPCAAVAARELVRAGLDVTMLDAGRGAPRGVLVRAGGRTLFRWTQGGFLTRDRHRSSAGPVSWTSSLSLGGLTNFWTGAVPRFAPEDFTDGAAIDERFIWPISYDDLAPFYDLVEDDLEITVGETEIPFVPRGRAAHIRRPPTDWRALAAESARHGTTLAPIPISMGSPWMIALRPREFVSHHRIVRGLQQASNFRLRPSARVLGVEFDDSRGVATGVRYVDLASGDVRRQPAAAVVIAAGPLDTTEILLRSRSGTFPTGLGNAYGVLGRYLHDHPREWWPARPKRPMTALVQPLYIGREPYDPATALIAHSLTIGLGSPSARVASLFNRPTSDFGVQTFGTMVPEDRVGVSLHSGLDPDDPRSMLHLDLAYDQRAIDNIVGARRRFVDALAAAGNPMEIGPFHDLLPGTSVHFGGTARMHANPEFGIVDSLNRVHGAPNVLACDASCFTTGPEKNPTLTAMAIAARAARHLAADLR